MIQDNIIMLIVAWNPLGFHFLEALPDGRIFMPNTIVTISSRNQSGCAHRLERHTSLFMRPMHAHALPNKVGILVPKMRGGLPQIP
jgi:hypothetical protein